MISHLFGTHQWAKETRNIQKGCSHGCRYCYAKADMINYGKGTAEEWPQEVLYTERLERKLRPINSMVMYPSTHDITMEHLPEHLKFIEKLLAVAPSVLIVSKPHLSCIEQICERFIADRGRIIFRFTIGSASDEVLKFWEPNAPSFEERLSSLKHAFECGFKTSVSCEPMLDDKIDDVIKLVSPLVNESIWLGKANYLIERLTLNGYADQETMDKAEELLAWQSDENIISLYKKYKDDPMIMMKESILKAFEKHNNL